MGGGRTVRPVVRFRPLPEEARVRLSLLALALLLACGCPGPSGPTTPFQPRPRQTFDGVPHWPRVPEYVEREREDWW